MVEQARSITRVSSKKSRIRPPSELARLFANPPVVGTETRADYQRLLDSIAETIDPTDIIAWLYVYQITDTAWEIIRERNLKRQVLENEHIRQIKLILVPLPRFGPHHHEFEILAKLEEWEKLADAKYQQWLSDPSEQAKMEAELAAGGYNQAVFMIRTLRAAAEEIDAIDQRIATYELRWMAALRAVENYSESLARRLRAASSNAIDGPAALAAE
jgi:hypothetical protein